jgi:hypothetical protein
MRFLKVIIPPLVAFLMFVVLINYNPLSLSLNGLSEIGDGSASGLMNYFKIFAPFQFLTAVLTQYLIILPLWDKILLVHKSAFGIFLGVILICLVLAIGISYIICDRATGTNQLINTIFFMTGVQTLYWAINFLTLAVFDWKTLQKAQSVKTKAEGKDETS